MATTSHKIVPRVTFGMIVLNGEPFVRYHLRALYPFAHQIIVVEGAAASAPLVPGKGRYCLRGV